LIRRRVVYAPEAQADLIALYDHIADAASPEMAFGYVSRVEAWLAGFDIASERGARRDDIRPGLRTVGFERRLTAAFAIEGERVLILRVFYGGQDWGTVLGEW